MKSCGGQLGLEIEEGTFLVNSSKGGSGLTSLTCAAGATFDVTEAAPAGIPTRVRNLIDCAFAGTFAGNNSASASDYNATRKDGWGELRFTGQGRYANTGPIYVKGETNTMTITQSEVHCGRVDVNAGVLTAAADGTYSPARLRVAGAGGSNGQINVASGAKLWYPKNETWTAADFGGNGTILFSANLDGSGTQYTLTGAGGTWTPGASVGILSVTGKLAWARNGTTNSVLEIEIDGAGGIAGADHDQLQVSGTVSGLNADPANSTVDLVVRVNPNLGRDNPATNTIVSAPAQNFSGLQFGSVTWPTAGSTGTVVYANGSISIADVKGPAAAGMLILLL